jgi:HAD superfamily hydrolase (TIGR01509 family)
MTTPLPFTRRPRAVLFDYDGVLVASEPIHLLAWLQLLDELGLPQDRKIVQNSVGKIAPQILTTFLDTYRPGWTPQDWDFQKIVQRKNDIYVERAKKELQLYPGVREGLEWLKSEKIRVAIVSNGRRRELEKTIRYLELHSYLDEVISRDDVPAAKPDPTPYLMGAAALGCEVGECIAVEDSPTGIEAALHAKVPSAAITTNFPFEVMQAPVPGRPDLKPTWIFESARSFFEMLKKLQERS